MKKYAVKLIEKIAISEGVVEFRFEKPSEFSYRAGQFCEISLDVAPHKGFNPGAYSFSLVSAPSDDYLAIATRMRPSVFKKRLDAISIGQKVFLEGPYGNFILKDNSNQDVLLAGGIGVTPIVSMLRQEVAANSERKFTVILANRNEARSPYLNELSEMFDSRELDRLVAVMSGPDDGWSGEAGHIDSDLLDKYTNRLDATDYYVVGTEDFVRDIRRLLSARGIDSSRIVSEDYYGY